MRKKAILKFFLYSVLSLGLIFCIAFIIVYQEFGPVDHNNLVIEDLHNNGIVAKLFYPKESKGLPIIIGLSGSGGGFLDEKEMQFLALEGYAVASLAYFKQKGLPQKLEEIPLEYFKNAMDIISQHPVVDSAKIIVLGVSRGAELALVLASYYPQIKGVVAYAPGCFILPSNTETPDGRLTRSSWTIQGTPLPFAPILPLREKPENVIAYRRYIDPLLKRTDQDAYRIKVENSKAAILLLSGQDDQTWPAAEMSTLLEQRLKSKNYPYPVKNVIFSDAGHWLLLFKQSYPILSSIFFHAFTLKIDNQQYQFALGGTVMGNLAARRAARKEALTFLERFKKSNHLSYPVSK